MKYLIFLMILFLSISSCYDELPKIETNLLHNEEIPLFEIDSVSIISQSPVLNVRVYYSTKYFELTVLQQDRLPFTRIFRDDEEIFVELMYKLNENSNFILFFDDIIETNIACYDFFFSNSRSSGFITEKTREIELCIEL